MKPLRLTFFILLLANVIFFAWRQNAGPAAGHEPHRLQAQLDADKLKLILPERPAAAPAVQSTAAPSATADAAVTTEKPTDSKPAEPTPPATPAAPVSTAPAPAAPTPAVPAPAPDKATKSSSNANTAPTPLLCKAFGGLTPEAAKAAQSDINTRAPNVKTSLQTVKEAASYWVHIPPQGSKAGAEKKVGELKQLGVEESFIISDEGSNRWAVSLGLFRSKETAESFLQKLNKQGVRSAKIEVRDKDTEKVRLEVSAPAEALGVLAREIKPLANATLGDCKVAGQASN